MANVVVLYQDLNCRKHITCLYGLHREHRLSSSSFDEYDVIGIPKQ